MNTIRTLSMLTALGLASAASAPALAGQGAAEQQPTPPATESQPNPASDPNAASSPHQRDVTGTETGQGVDKTTEAPTTTNPDPSGATSPHQRDTVQKAGEGTERGMDQDKLAMKPKDKLVGLPVESSTGQQLGSIVDIVRDDAGTPTYAVVAIDNDTTAVPYAMAASMVSDGKVIMSSSRLTAAPKVKQTEWTDATDSKWRTEADRYWGTTRTASPNETPPSTER